MAVIDDVAAERQRQVEVFGWTAEHDDTTNGPDDLMNAAGCYCLFGFLPVPPLYWPWDAKWWNPGNYRRRLVKAAALIVAEIERFDRKEANRGR